MAIFFGVTSISLGILPCPHASQLGIDSIAYIVKFPIVQRVLGKTSNFTALTQIDVYKAVRHPPYPRLIT